MQHLNAYVCDLIGDQFCMVLAAPHDVPAEWLCIQVTMTMMMHHLEIHFGIAVQNVVEHEITE